MPKLVRSSGTGERQLSATGAKGASLGDNNVIKDDYVVADDGDCKGVERPLTTVTNGRAKQALQLALGRKPIHALLGGQATVTSAANAATAASAPIDVVSLADFSSFALLYDECRVIGIDAFIYVTSGNVPATVGAQFAANIDPANKSAPTSVVDVICNAYNVGPYPLWNSQVVYPQSSCVAGQGHAPMIRMPKSGLAQPASLGSGTDAQFVGGDWFSTAASSAYCAYLKVYVQAIGAGLTTSATYTVRVHCEFKARS